MANMSFRSLFIAITRICLILSVGLSVNVLEGQSVIVRKVGKGYLYIFPALRNAKNPAGVINVGESITVMYSLKLIGTAHARFIGMDASLTTGISPRLTTMKRTEPTFGFFVRDTNQSTLEVVIDPSFMQKIANETQKQIQGSIASEGNLNVTLWKKKRNVVIKEVRLE